MTFRHSLRSICGSVPQPPTFQGAHRRDPPPSLHLAQRRSVDFALVHAMEPWQGTRHHDKRCSADAVTELLLVHAAEPDHHVPSVAARSSLQERLLLPRVNHMYPTSIKKKVTLRARRRAKGLFSSPNTYLGTDHVAKRYRASKTFIEKMNEPPSSN